MHSGNGYRQRLVVMVKTPKAGQVKTRLSRDIGLVAATSFYRQVVRTVVARVSADPRWETLIAVSPDVDVTGPYWPGHIGRIKQGAGDLGHRMQSVFGGMPPGPVVIIGTDIPEITPAHIAAAFDRLGDNDAVFGPSDDGGYWLVGQKRSPAVHAIFDNVRWSSKHTLSDTLDNLKGQRVAEIMMLRDVDNGSEYHDLKDQASRLII